LKLSTLIFNFLVSLGLAASIGFNSMAMTPVERISKLSNIVRVVSPIGLAKPDEAGDKKAQRIDTHIHLYDTRREGSAVFLDPVKHSKIYFPHFSSEFVEVAKPAGVDFAIVVEASQRREDNFWLMNQVDSADVLLAFIANMDPRDSWYEKDLDLLSKSPKFRGIRIRTIKPIDLADPQIVVKFSALELRNLVLELGVNNVEPEVVGAIARRYPKMNIILNHLAGGRIFNDPVRQEAWKARLKLFAAEPNVYCKVSALFDVSGQNPAPLNPDFYDVLIDPVVAAFGPERVMFGSNWTLSDMFGTYGNLIRMVDGYCSKSENLLPEKFFFENAKRAYGLK
jgi:predicted TIM-barrel fold metal-dependent hydrolase